MAKLKDQKNTLTIEDMGNGSFRLFGYVAGKQIRKQGADLAKLETIKHELEIGALEKEAALSDRKALPDSWIGADRLRDAEAAIQLLGASGLTLAQCVQVGLANLGTGAPVAIETAVAEYLACLKEDGSSKRHQDNCRLRLAAFFRTADAQMLGEVSEDSITRYCLRAGSAPYTRLGDAQVIRAFFNYCSARRLLRANPFTIDMEKQKKRADQGRERPIILSADQAEALLKAAVEIDEGREVPFLLLCLWGGIRRAEVARLTVDDIQFEGKGATAAIRPNVSKTASYRDVVLPENIVPLLRECVEAGLLDKEPIGKTFSECYWADIRARAGLVACVKMPPYGKRQVTEICWQANILRHTGLSYFYKKTGNIAEVSRQAGHSDSIAFKHYITLAKAADVEKFYAISATLTPKEAPALVA